MRIGKTIQGRIQWPLRAVIKYRLNSPEDRVAPDRYPNGLPKAAPTDRLRGGGAKEERGYTVHAYQDGHYMTLCGLPMGTWLWGWAMPWNMATTPITEVNCGNCLRTRKWREFAEAERR